MDRTRKRSALLPRVEVEPITDKLAGLLVCIGGVRVCDRNMHAPRTAKRALPTILDAIRRRIRYSHPSRSVRQEDPNQNHMLSDQPRVLRSAMSRSPSSGQGPGADAGYDHGLRLPMGCGP